MSKPRKLRTTTLVILAGLVLTVTVAASVPTHVVREHQTTTQLLWNQQTGFMISGMRRDGWSGNGAEFVWQIVAGLLGRPFQFNESRTWSVLAHIDGAEVRRFVRDNESFQFVEPFNGEIYTVSGPPRKWNGHELVPTEETSSPQFKARKFLSPPYKNANGWSSRINLLNQGNSRFEYTLDLAGGKSVVIADRSDWDQPTLNVLMANGQSIQILAVDERFRRVSSDEYADLMQGKLPPQP